MSDANPTQHDAAILVLRERERELFAEMQDQQRKLELATARREELLDLIATLSRKPRARKVRGTPDVNCMQDANRLPLSGEAIFGAPPSIVE